MGTRDDDLYRAGPWPLGINNMAKEGQLPADEEGHTQALRDAVNVDLDAAGRPTRRRGCEWVFDGQLTHSLWSAPDLPFGLLVDGGVLQVMFPDESVQSLDVQVSNQPLSYALINDRVYFSNRTTCGMVSLGLDCAMWAPEHPGGQPDLELVDGFALAPGQYQVAITFADRLGRESGSTLAATIDVGDGQGIVLANIPQPASPDTTAIHVYCTDANDQVLRLALVLAPGTVTAMIAAAACGRSLATQFLRPLPPGQMVRYANGRQFVAVGREVLVSEPLRYGMFNPISGRIRFAHTVDLLEPAGNEGLYVAAGGRTFWLQGTDPATVTQRICRSSGAVPGTGIQVAGDVLGLETAENLPVWLAQSGHFCVGMPGGSVVVLKEGQAVTDGAGRGAALLRQQDGLQQLIVSLRGPHSQGLAIKDRAVAHILYDGS